MQTLSRLLLTGLAALSSIFISNPRTDINRDGVINGIDASLLILLWSP